MIEERRQEIDGIEYVTRQLGAGAALKVLSRLKKLLGPALANILKAEGVSLRAVLSDAAALGQGLEDLFHRYEHDDIKFLVDAFLPVSQVVIEGKAVPLAGIYELHFAGKMTLLYRWLWFCLKANFEDFSSAATDLSSLVGAKAAA